MNYRHAFHAGNFADLVKHAALTRLLARLTAEPGSLRVVDTHAGAGLYDLSDPAQARSKEAEAGIMRLAGRDLPEVFDGLAEAVTRRNPQGPVRTYPGSPALILDALRPGDAYVACELRGDDHARLATLLGGRGEARLADGYETAEAEAGRGGRLFLLIDPPFERADDYLRCTETLEAVLARAPQAVAMVWLPIKDLETLDAFVRRLEEADLPDLLIAEARLRPLTGPMRMNGCALALVNAPEGFDADLKAICGYVVETLGEPGGEARVWRPND